MTKKAVENFDSKEFRNIFEAIKIASYTLDKNLFRRKILDAISESLRIDKSLIVLQDEDTCCLDWMLRHVYEKPIAEYEEYYHTVDPFKVLSGPSHNRKIVSGPLSKRIVVRLQEIVDYPSFLSTEYYNGFLRQLRIYHEAIVYLTSQNKVLGFISLYRPEESTDFSKDEIEILKMISPYIAATLETIDLRNKSGIKDAVIETMGERFHQGLLLLNESMKLVYMNQKAREFCKGLQRDISRSRHIRHPIPGILIEDCYPLKEEFKSIPSIFPVLPKCRIIESKGKRYSVRSQVVENDMHLGNKNFFLVLVDQISDLNSLNEERIKEFFHLTKREIEIVTYIFKGLRYTEIAEKLFISVFTVKKHIQNIFQKLGVNNRTALVHKILCTCDLDVIQMTEG